jgi:DNA-binding response OmpR family regulator
MAVILVVEDELAVAELVETALAEAGHEVRSAINGRHGLQQLSQRRADLVLLDYLLPVMDGAALLKAMCESAAWHEIPAVVMSSLPESAVAAAAGGMYGAFLHKPFRLAAMVEVVEAVLGSHSAPARQHWGGGTWRSPHPN